MRNMIAAFCVALGLVVAGTAQAQDKFVLKLGWVTSDNDNDPYAIGAHNFKKEVEERSQGRIEVQLFPNAQLGDERRMLEQLRFGTLDAGIIVNSVVAQLEPSFQVHELPFIYPKAEDARRVLDGEVGAKLAERLAAKGIMLVGPLEGGYRVILNNVRPVTGPADMKGVKYRVMQNPVFVDMFTMLGANPIPLSIGEAFIAVQQGTVEGIDNAAAFIAPNKWNEILRYVSVTNHTYSAAHLLVSKAVYDRLPEDLQKVVSDSGRAAVDYEREIYAGIIAKTFTELADKGMLVNMIDDPKPFRDAVQPLYDKYRDAVGGDIMDAVLKSVESSQ